MQSTAHHPPLDPPLTLAALRPFYPLDPKKTSIITSELQHRLTIIQKWNLTPGSRVLEIGPGQGDCTIVLAAAVGETGHVDAVDPGSLDYGAPVTLGQAQSALSNTTLGPRITWIQADPATYLSTHPLQTYDYVICFHSLWYFATPSLIPSLFRHLLTNHTSPRLLIAEHALQAHSLASVPHVLAAFARAALEVERGEGASRANIRSLVGPGWIKEVAGLEGWVLRGEEVVVPPRELSHGRWEVEMLGGEGFVVDVEGVCGGDERKVGLLRGMRDAVLGSAEGIEGGVKGVESMCVWAGEFGTE